MSPRTPKRAEDLDISDPMSGVYAMNIMKNISHGRQAFKIERRRNYDKHKEAREQIHELMVQQFGEGYNDQNFQKKSSPNWPHLIKLLEEFHIKCRK